jgi:hypothetical protein
VTETWRLSQPPGAPAAGGLEWSALQLTCGYDARTTPSASASASSSLSPSPSSSASSSSSRSASPSSSASASDFIGFYSTTANISSLSITVADPASSSFIFSTIDNLYLAIPSPGAAALIGLAGLASRRRRA